MIGSLGSVASKRCNFNNESYGILVNHQVKCKRCQVKLHRLSRFVNCMKLLIWPCRFPQLNWEHTHKLLLLLSSTCFSKAFNVMTLNHKPLNHSSRSAVGQISCAKYQTKITKNTPADEWDTTVEWHRTKSSGTPLTLAFWFLYRSGPFQK